MVKAVIHIVVEPKHMDRVLDKLLSSSVIEKIYEVTGEYDLIAVANVSSYEEAAKFVREELHSLEGVIRTVTSLVVEEYPGRNL